MNFLTRLFDPAGFPARWKCGTGWSEDPWLGYLHIGSDLGVWGAYVAIPLVLGYFLVRRKDLPFRTIFLLFGAFILACGTTHLMEAIIFYWPAYRLAGVIKLFTAVVSWATVVSLTGVVPNVLAMRSPQELEREISARKLAEEALQQANAQLERRVQERTAELTHVVAQLTEQEERLRLALEATNLGIFDYNPRTKERNWSPQCKEIFGLSPDADVRSADMLQAVHADDRGYVNREFSKTLDPRESGEFVMEYRVIRPDRTLAWVLARGKTFFADNSGERQAVRTLGTMLDITKRKESEEELRASKQALQEADRRKDEFLATLAHELRNPLAPIRNSLEVMKRCGDDPAVMGKSRGMIERQTLHMVRLVDDLIDVSRISRGQLVLRREVVSLAGIIQQAVEGCGPAIEAAGHGLNVDLPPDSLCVQADPVRLVQIFGNLLNNACKYTPPGGKIWISAVTEGAEVAVKVCDNGMGIPPELLPQTFEMFTQLDRTLERAQGGLGIGLTLVKRLVELHGGTVTAHSEGANRGAEFSIRLPVCTQPDAPLPPADSAERPVAGRKILVVDDNRDAALTMAMLLRITGNKIEMAHDGHEAVQRAVTFQPDLVLLDIGMPVMNGYDACRAIRQQVGGDRVRIVALTGWGQEDDRRKSREAGFDAHLVKPVEHATLLKTLEELVPR